MSADDMRARVDASWRALRDSIGRADLDATTPAGWSGKEMLAHVAFWLETVPPFVTGAFRGDASAFSITFPSGYAAGDGEWPSADVHNAREAAWARAQPVDMVVARADRAYDSLRTFLATVGDGEEIDHAVYFREIADHLEAHRRDELGD